MPLKLTITTIHKLHNWDHVYVCLENEGYGKNLVEEVYKGLQAEGVVDFKLSNGSVMTVSISGEVDEPIIPS